TDMTSCFNPIGRLPAVTGGSYAGGGGITNISTPYGQGWEVKVSNLDVTMWDNTVVTMSMNKDFPFSRENTTEHWTWNWFIPSQTLVPSFMAGVIFEIGHTDSSSGHHISLYNASDGLNTMRIRRQSAAGQVYTEVPNIPIIWDRWFPVVMDCKYSNTPNGYLRVWIDGKQWLNYSGPTAFGDTVGKMSFGWYRMKLGNNVMNTIRVADLRYTIT